MKLLFWNSRGSFWPDFLAQTSLNASNLDIDVLCILGPRASKDIVNKTKTLPFDAHYVIPAQGQCGGLLLLWKSRMVHVDIILPHNCFVHCVITEIATNNSWYTTFIYVYPQKEKQEELWNEISALAMTNGSLWEISIVLLH